MVIPNILYGEVVDFQNGYYRIDCETGIITNNPILFLFIRLFGVVDCKLLPWVGFEELR